MKAGLRRWWPALPAALILYWGLGGFIEEYPAAARPFSRQHRGVGTVDSLLTFVKAASDTSVSDTSASGTSLTRSSAAFESGSGNPFRSFRGSIGGESPRGPARMVALPNRNFQLHGTVGDEVATLSSNQGGRQILRVGDVIDSAVILAIEPNRVQLKDRAGKFELLMEK